MLQFALNTDVGRYLVRALAIAIFTAFCAVVHVQVYRCFVAIAYLAWHEVVIKHASIFRRLNINACSREVIIICIRVGVGVVRQFDCFLLLIRIVSQQNLARHVRRCHHFARIARYKYIICFACEEYRFCAGVCAVGVISYSKCCNISHSRALRCIAWIGVSLGGIPRRSVLAFRVAIVHCCRAGVALCVRRTFALILRSQGRPG